MVETCHRVELHGLRTRLPARLVEFLPARAEMLGGRAAARQLISLAVGRDSAVMGEDQVLHQLRLAAQRARAEGGLEPELDRLIDIALRAGRLARSLLPGRRSNLAERALGRVLGEGPGGRVLVVGAGEMGRLAAIALRRRGAAVLLASRTSVHASAVAAELSVPSAPFDPGPALAGRLDGVVLALRGRWSIDRATARALRESAAWIVDLSTPIALPADLATAVGARLTTIDDLATIAPRSDGHSPAIAARLDALVEQALAEYDEWLSHSSQRDAAHALTMRAESVSSAELGRLLEKVTLDDHQRAAVEQMVTQVTRRLLHDPLERLGQDRDGRHERAARDLFRL